MTGILFILYIALGSALGFGLVSYAGLSIPVAVALGAVTTTLLGQFHLLFSHVIHTADSSDRMDALELSYEETGRRMTRIEARSEEVETSLKHELSERRDALVSEMRQLEGLIDRLAKSFESKLSREAREPMAPREDALLRNVKAALQDGRVDLHLQPIVSLPQRRVAFYEGFTRLREADGTLILPADFLEAARRARLLGLVDNMLLFRCVQIVRRLAERDRRVGVFCNISPNSLTDPQFFPHFLEFMQENRDLAGALIFEIPADRFENRSRQMRESMEKLTQLGFRFSIDHAHDLAINLPRLQEAGVRFIKMKGDDLIAQLGDPYGPRPESNINRRLAGEEVAAVCSRFGVTLIAEKMEEEVSVVEVLEYDIPFGQGHVFGAPKPIKSSLMQETAPPQEFIDRLSAFG
ncbi:MAG: diguanylate phosphodiesterase [Henriciella sp.]|jgi:cyclic-di-GMP phosphodiesterase TipF (flagellum assembly factor)|uniref:EAL domain-containing protein n=1 Tax=Henriciella sp. TaxID=1968823 RepID=UPI000C0E1A17|nr:EAL domain-containing protein [Henriciella sp.]MAN74588.1 diguanylate phosphodiesterase [Henriciella sp.]PHR81830.1 MAG: diguanylate phosphodiesterase [Henriciella sp.]|tara:strand:- start:3289 stop:4515 length:1227 start_codon:yes stop_codon:yes gene_type:complete